jgi:predicted AlkP superfamily pyrophosphatase or phosphodiesterase
MLSRISVALRIVVLVLAVCRCSFTLRASTNHHVILITIDGFAAYYLADPKAPIPTIRKLAAEGAVAEGMRASNPSVTWPNHTTLVTGVTPAKHGVLFNGVLQRPGAGKPVRIDPEEDQTNLVSIPTLFDQLHRAGYRTAAINWPCTRNATGLEDNFPDVPDQIKYTTPRLREELIATHVLESASDDTFHEQSAPVRDQIWTAAAAHVIRQRRPNLLLLHMLITDSMQHKYGPQSPGAYAAIALADAQLAEVLRAVDAAGIREHTTLIVTADHGFAAALKIVNPNVALRRAGLLHLGTGAELVNVRAQSVSEGGVAMVYLNGPATRDADRAKVTATMTEQEGVADVLTPEKFDTLGLSQPSGNPQMADLILVAKDGYAFNNEARGDKTVTEVTLAAGNQGHHGYLADNAKMNALFVASGRRIKRGVKLGIIDNTDVAPTIASLLGQKLENCDGHVLEEMLVNGVGR